MKIETTPRDDHQITMQVEVEADKMEGAKRRAARKIAQKVKISGFRPGKAPYDVIRRNVGDGAIFEEAIEMLIEEIYPAALKEANIEPGAMGSLENVEGTETPKLTFIVPLQPAVELGDYKSVRKAYEWTAPSDSDVDARIEELREMYSSTQTVEREIAEGDFGMVDVKATVKDAEIEELTRTGFPLFLRPEAREDEWPFSGFGKEVLGAKPGDVKEFSHKFPKDYAVEAVQGKNVKFEVTVKVVRGVTKPELNDDFAQMVGAENLEDLRKKVSEDLTAHSKSEYDDKYFVELFDEIKSGATLKYAPQALDHEAEHVVEDLKRRLTSQRMDFETYLKTRDMDEAKFLAEEARPIAQKRFERSLLIDEIGRQAKIQLPPEELEAEFQQQWAALSTQDEQFAKLTKNGTKASKELVDAVVMDTANRMVVSRVLDHVKAVATGNYTEIPTEEAPAAETPEVEKPAKKKASKKAAKSEE